MRCLVILEPPGRGGRRPAVPGSITTHPALISIVQSTPQAWTVVCEVQAVGPTYHQARRLERLLAHVVGAVAGASPVILSVELGDEARTLVEQIRDAEEPAVEVEDRSIDLWSRQAGAGHVEDAEPRLPGAAGGSIGQFCSRSGERDTLPAMVSRDVAAEACQLDPPA
jgi:hypothetical protein